MTAGPGPGAHAVGVSGHIGISLKLQVTTEYADAARARGGLVIRRRGRLSAGSRCSRGLVTVIQLLIHCHGGRAARL